jgi:hypothetical protein
MLSRKLVVGLIILLGFGQACRAEDSCSALRPNPPRDISQEIVGKIDGRLDGLAKRLLSIGGNIDGTYREVSKDVLKDYPNADKLYIWGSTLYIYCVIISGSRMSDSEKLDRIRDLFDRANQPPPLSMTPCTPGATVRPVGDTFHLRILAIDENEAVRLIMNDSIQNNRSDYAKRILEAFKAGIIRPISDPALVTVRIRGVIGDSVPSQIPYLAGQDICQRMVAASRLRDGVVVVTIPISGRDHLGEATIVLPRAMLETSRIVQVCIEPTFQLAYATEIRQNMYCDKPEKTGLFQAILKGEERRTYIITRRKT